MSKIKLSSSLKKNKKPNKKGKSKNHFLRNKIIGFVFLILALILLIFPSYSPTQKPNEKNPIVISKDLQNVKKTQSNPIRILIPKADIDLPVVDAKIVNGYWEISETTASYGLGSGHPGEKGNTVIFAHARQGLFYNLKDVKVQDIIYVFTKDKWFKYKVNKITEVFPNQTEVIEPTKNQVLTLYTCSGFFDEKRLIITAVPQN